MSVHDIKLVFCIELYAKDKLHLTLYLICSSMTEVKSGGRHRHHCRCRRCEYVCHRQSAHVPGPGTHSKPYWLYRYRLSPIAVRLNECVFLLNECHIIWAHQQALSIVILPFEQTAHVVS